MTNEAAGVYETSSATDLPVQLIHLGWVPEFAWYFSIAAMPIASAMILAYAWRCKARGRRVDWAKPGVQLVVLIQVTLALVLFFTTLHDLLWCWGTGKRLMWESGKGWQVGDKVIGAIRLAHALTSLSLRVISTACCLVVQIFLPRWKSDD